MMQEKSILYQTKKISYTVAGAGKVVMLVHGFGEDGTVWKNQLPELQNQFQIIIPDLPGSGQSEFIEEADIDTYAALLQKILVHEQVQQCCMIGHSMGGYITLAFAEKFPQLLQSFGLLHSTAFADSDEKKAARLKSIEFIEQQGSYEFLKTTIPNLFYNIQHPDLLQLTEKGKSFLPEALIQYYKAMINRPDRRAILKNCGLPVLFIIGKYDKAVPFAQSMAQCHFPGISYITVLQHDAHMGMLESALETNRALKQFLHLYA